MPSTTVAARRAERTGTFANASLPAKSTAKTCAYRLHDHDHRDGDATVDAQSQQTVRPAHRP